MYSTMNQIWRRLFPMRYTDVGDKQSATAPGKPETIDNDTVHEKRETKHAHPKQSGKPICLECGSDCILLGWDGPQSEGVEFYEIKYKVTNERSWNRKMITTEDDKPQFRVRGLVQETEYMFKVRAQYEDEEGEFSEPSDSIQTTQSPALDILKSSRKLNNETKHAHPNQPSTPICLECGSDFILLGWDGPQSEGVEFYEIKYKVTNERSWNRKMITTEDDKPQCRVRGLVQETEYMFKVRAQYMDDEGEFSKPSDSIQTTQSPALGILKSSWKLQDGEPAIYKLPVVEIPEARNTKYKTRKCQLEAPLSCEGFQEKTIMMIGATGSGKSTLIDGMVNHLLGVKWEDGFRFKIIDLMADEETRKGSEADSQTDWITNYRVHSTNKNVKFIYNIIDTPGFGDTRGIERDQQLVDQIRAFFTTKGVQGIETIDAVCFVTQAPLARLTHTQRYIYESILSIFGKDMKDNFVAMITFADGKEPPVLNALVQAEVPINKHFLFNNSALFEANSDAKVSKFGKMFWDMGLHSYDRFFYYLPQIKSQSLQLTAEVLQKREQINVTLAGLLPQIEIGLSDLETLKKEKELVNDFAKEIENNKNFTYETEETCWDKVYLEPGECVTHCGHCDYTCHYPCGTTNLVGKIVCSAMSWASCTVCPGKCGWRFHGNSGYRYTVSKRKVKKSYEEMKAKFDLATESKVTKEQLLEKIKKKFNLMKDNVCKMINKLRGHSNYLRQNAIKANPLTEIEYLELLIKTEQQQKKSGFQERVDMLQKFKDAATFKAKAIEMSTDELMEDFGLQDEDM